MANQLCLENADLICLQGETENETINAGDHFGHSELHADGLILKSIIDPHAAPPVCTTSISPPLPTLTFTLNPTLIPISTLAPENVQEMIDRCQTAVEIAAIDADLLLTFSGDPTAGTLMCQVADGLTDQINSFLSSFPSPVLYQDRPYSE